MAHKYVKPWPFGLVIPLGPRQVQGFPGPSELPGPEQVAPLQLRMSGNYIREAQRASPGDPPAARPGNPKLATVSIMDSIGVY